MTSTARRHRSVQAWLALRLPAGSFGRALGLLVGGSVAGQLIMLAFSPLITRLYSPDDFGVLGVYLSWLTIVTVGAMLRYEAAIPGADSEQDVTPLLLICVALAVFVSLAAQVLLMIAGHRFANISQIHLLWPYRYYVAPGIFVASLYISLSYWAIREKRFSLISKTKIVQNSGSVLTQVGLGTAHMGAAGLLSGQIVGQLSSSISILRNFFSVTTRSPADISSRRITAVALRYHRFPKLSLPASVMEACATALPVLYIASSYGDTVAGWMTLVQRIIFVPVALLTSNMTQIYFGELASMKRSAPQSMKTAYISRLLQLAKMAVPGALLLALASPIVIPALFGRAWRPSVTCLEILLPMLVTAFIAIPFGCTLDVLERQDLHLLRDAVRLFLVVGALFIAHWLQLEWTAAMVAVSIAGCLGNGIYLYFSWIGIRNFKWGEPSHSIVGLAASTHGDFGHD